MQSFIAVLIFSFIFYRFFLSIDPLIANDWPLLFPESRDFSPFWSIAWDYMGQGGLGGPAFKTFWIDLYTNFIYFVSNSTNFPWWASQRVFWILPFILISVFSSYKFSSLLIKKPSYKVTSSIIYSFNTYTLLVVGGGQFGIAFAYGILPLVLYSQINFYNATSLRNLFFAALLSGLIVAMDPRISLLVFLVSALWYLVFVKNFSFKKLTKICLSFLIALLLNSYWILPILLARESYSTFAGYTSLKGVEFLSFAKFENSISLLHPNWPENIFGRTYFMRPEFLITPILAFSGLLFKVKKEILFFALIALLGAFLGKGTNEPYGEVYSLLFQYIPGFNLFRDSTKFFILVSLSYSLLIPYVLENLSKLNKYLFIVVFIAYWLFILKPGWSGELTGTFGPKAIPQEYLALKENIKKDEFFYRTLWIPQKQRFGFYSTLHPIVSANEGAIQIDNKHTAFKALQESAVKYVIIPYDSESEIFLDDRSYSEEKYLKTIEKVRKIKYLKQIDGFGKIAVFEVPNPKPHISSTKPDLVTAFKFLNPTKYQVNVRDAVRGDKVIFSESFDAYWFARKIPARPAGGDPDDPNKLEIGKAISSKPYNKRLNSFTLKEGGNYALEIFYLPQRWVNLGLIISLATLLLVILGIYRFRRT